MVKIQWMNFLLNCDTGKSQVSCSIVSFPHHSLGCINGAAPFHPHLPHKWHVIPSYPFFFLLLTPGQCQCQHGASASMITCAHHPHTRSMQPHSPWFVHWYVSPILFSFLSFIQCRQWLDTTPRWWQLWWWWWWCWIHFCSMCLCM